MEPLSTPRKIFILFCVWSADEAGWKKAACVIFTFKISLYGLFTVFGFSIGVYAALFVFFSRHKINNIFLKLSEIYDQNKQLDSFRYLQQANNKSEHIWRIFLVYTIAGMCIITVFSSLLSVVLCFYFSGEFHREFAYVPFTYVLPWNQETLLGYVAEIVCIIVTDEGYLLSSGAVLLLYISICLHHRAFYEMFRHFLRNQEHPKSVEMYRELIFDVIRFHSSVKSWFIDTAQAFRPLLMFQLIANNMSIACIVFHLKLELEHIDFDICNLLTAASIGILILTLYCYYGKLATDSFGMMAFCLYEHTWYELPVDLQKYFIFMIGNANKPVYYTGSGIATLNLETGTKLIKMIYTWIMMFSTITDS